MHLFTYGTLMFPEVWQAVVGRPFAAIAGQVSGYALYRVRDAVFPGMVATTTGAPVVGIVYLDVDDEAVARLDRFEDDFYRTIVRSRWPATTAGYARPTPTSCRRAPGRIDRRAVDVPGVCRERRSGPLHRPLQGLPARVRQAASAARGFVIHDGLDHGPAPAIEHDADDHDHDDHDRRLRVHSARRTQLSTSSPNM